MPAAKRGRRDPLTEFYKLPAVPNNVLNDERRVGDRDFFERLDLSYGPLEPVADALRLGDLPAAKTAVVTHFQTRSRPRITKYRTDPHGSDWGNLTVTRRADLLCRNKIARANGDILDADGGPAAHGGINWDIALSENHEIRRQGAILTLAEAWSRARSASAKRKYAQALERWIRAHIAAEPFENLSTQVGPNEYLRQLDSPRFRGYRMADIFRRTIGPCFFSTVYYPYHGQAPRVTVDALTPKTTPFRNDPCHAVRIDDGQFQDIWFVQRDFRRLARHSIAGDGVALETDAACVYLSIRNRRVVDGFRIGGHSVVWRGRRLPIRAFRLVKHVGD